MIDKLDAETVDDGKAHPFVVALVRELQTKQTAILGTVMSPGTDAANLPWLAGHANAVGEVLRLIATAKGKTE